MTDLQAEHEPAGAAASAAVPTSAAIPAPQAEDALEARAARVASRGGSKPTRVVAARMALLPRLAELWASRELFAFLVRKEIKVKYKNSVLGFLWSMLNPAFTLAVFYVLFTFFLPNGIPNFVIYMFAAMLLWNLFQTAVLSGTGVIVANSGIVKKVAFPREILALASVGSAFMFFLFQSTVLLVFMVAFWHRPAWADMWLIVPALAAIVLFSSALCVFLSAVNVYLRDTQHLVEVILMAWFWAIPGIYSYAQVGGKLAKHHILWLYFLNPLTPPVMTFQRVFYAVMNPVNTVSHLQQPVLANYPVHWYLAADMVVVALSLVLLTGALAVFGRLEGNFAEEL
ncbi:MAG TPA: ABC transporter permease [Acidimicrobiales bacterium]|nr:ABC transporter permease [Acidimicrobiales bacterium]